MTERTLVSTWRTANRNSALAGGRRRSTEQRCSGVVVGGVATAVMVAFWHLPPLHDSPKAWPRWPDGTSIFEGHHEPRPSRGSESTSHHAKNSVASPRSLPSRFLPPRLYVFPRASITLARAKSQSQYMLAPDNPTMK